MRKLLSLEEMDVINGFYNKPHNKYRNQINKIEEKKSFINYINQNSYFEYRSTKIQELLKLSSKHIKAGNNLFNYTTAPGDKLCNLQKFNEQNFLISDSINSSDASADRINAFSTDLTETRTPIRPFEARTILVENRSSKDACNKFFLLKNKFYQIPYYTR